jgi:hypothetical protein
LAFSLDLLLLPNQQHRRHQLLRPRQPQARLSHSQPPHRQFQIKQLRVLAVAQVARLRLVYPVSLLARLER